MNNTHSPTDPSRVFSKEIAAQARRIELRTRGLVESLFSGEYHSVFKGRGLEFSDVREYQPGDDVRAIDWNVTARYNAPFVKVFEEERELTVLIVYDASRSGHFGTRSQFKSEMAAEIGAVLGFSAIKNNDKVGLILFSDQIEKFIPPQKGKTHVLRVIRELIYYKTEDRQTNLSEALEYTLKVLKRNSVVFVLTDFFADKWAPPIKRNKTKTDLGTSAISP